MSSALIAHSRSLLFFTVSVFFSGNNLLQTTPTLTRTQQKQYSPETHSPSGRRGDKKQHNASVNTSSAPATTSHSELTPQGPRRRLFSFTPLAWTALRSRWARAIVEMACSAQMQRCHVAILVPSTLCPRTSRRKSRRRFGSSPTSLEAPRSSRERRAKARRNFCRLRRRLGRSQRRAGLLKLSFNPRIGVKWPPPWRALSSRRPSLRRAALLSRRPPLR